MDSKRQSFIARKPVGLWQSPLADAVYIAGGQSRELYYFGRVRSAGASNIAIERKGCRVVPVSPSSSPWRAVLAAGLGFLPTTARLTAADGPAQSSIWQAPSRADSQPSPKAAVLPRISVRGNRFVDPAGAPVLFRGVSIADPDNLLGRGQWRRELFAAAKDMGADLIRIPVHPAAWRRQTPQGYLALLDQAVGWCTDLGMHVIIDWHSIGNLRSGLFQEPVYETSVPETLEFWRTIAGHFKGNHTVAFYELFNEPTHFNGMLGTESWSDWRQLNEEMIGVIRYWDKEAIPLVAGFDWAYDLDAVHYDPVRAEGIGYVTHPYPYKRPQPWEPRWEENFAFAAARYPMIATEIGFDLKSGEAVGDDAYGNRITRFLEERGISWMAWVLDPEWGPPMLESFDGYRLNGAGAFFKTALQRPPAPPRTK
jgi:endoglucanase